MGTIDEAMRIGYRAFDCACDYGNEQHVGEALACAMKKHGVQRHELFITSKLWCTFMETEHVESACRRTLSDLNLEYLDLFLIHFPIALKYVDPKVRALHGTSAAAMGVGARSNSNSEKHKSGTIASEYRCDPRDRVGRRRHGSIELPGSQFTFQRSQ